MATVLLVDDHPSVRHALGLLLRGAGHTVLDADSGRRAVQICAVEHPDLVVADLNIPDMQGMVLISQLRQALPAVRFLGLSGGGVHQTPQTSLMLAREAGADSALAKPVANEDLLASVDALIDTGDG